MSLVPPWGTRSPPPLPAMCPPTPLPTPGELPAPRRPALTFQPRAYAWMISADRFICLYLFFCCGGERWDERGLGGPGGSARGGRDGLGKHGWDPPSHHVAPEPGGDDDLALAHQLVPGPAPPAPKRLLDEGGELFHALLAPLLQVEELGTARASAGVPSGDGDPQPGAAASPGSSQDGLGAAREARGPVGQGDLWGWHPLWVRPCPPLAARAPHSSGWGSRSPIPGLTVRGERMKILVWPNASSSRGNARSASSTSAPSLHRSGGQGWSEPGSPWTGGATGRACGLDQPRTCGRRSSGAMSGG